MPMLESRRSRRSAPPLIAAGHFPEQSNGMTQSAKSMTLG